jgi:hypothetical protein
MDDSKRRGKGVYERLRIKFKERKGQLNGHRSRARDEVNLKIFGQ